MMGSSKCWMVGLLVLCGCVAGQSERSDDVGPDAPEAASASVESTFWFPEPERALDPELFYTPPTAVTLELGLAPARPYYQPGQVLQLEPVARDAAGARVLGIRFEYTVSRADAVARFHGMPGRYELLDEGILTFEVCARAGLCASRSVIVDAGSPLLVLEEPASGAQLGADGSDAIVVRGSVADFRDSRVWVLGEPVEVDELGRFDTSVPAAFGVNHIFVSASDGISEQAQVRRDVLWAPAYLPTANLEAEQGIASALPDAALLSLGRSFFDDGTAVDSNAAPRSEDVADLVALVIERAELESQLPDPLVDAGDTLRLSVTDVRPEEVSVDLDVLDGALELFVRVSRLEVDTAGGMDLQGTTVSLDGGITATLSVLAQLSLRIDPQSGVEVELSEFHTLLESASSRFVASEANAVFRLAESALRSRLEEALSGVLADALVSQLPVVLEDALRSLEGLLRDQSFNLSFAPLPEQTLSLDGRFAEASLAHGRHVQLSLDVQVGSDKGPLHADAPGVPQRSAEPVSVAFESRDMQLALRLDLVNLLLHTLWNGGLLEIRGGDAAVSGDLGDLLEYVTLSGKLPPLLRDAYPWEQADAMLELGQVEVTVELGEMSRYGLYVALPVDVVMREGSISLELGVPQIDAWLIDSTADTPASGEDLSDLVVPLLLPVLDDALNGNPIGLDLPSFAVGELTSIAPSLEGFELSLMPGDDVVVRGDALIVDLQLIGAVP